MKRFLMTLSFIVAFGVSASAQEYSYYENQTDGFFTLNDEAKEYRVAAAGFPSLPGQGVYDDQLPLGSGLLLLAGMGAAYALRRRRK